MKTLNYKLLDVFTEVALAGNPVAVFPDAGDLSATLMQRIAAELNLSEVVFVTAGDARTHRYTVRIMTPATELPFAGHPTIGAAVALAGESRTLDPVTIELSELVGPVRVAVQPGPEHVHQARFTAPQPPAPVDHRAGRSAAAGLLGLDPDAIVVDPRSWSAGVPFLCVPVESFEALSAIGFDSVRWQREFADTPAPHVYAYWLAPGKPVEVHARMFAPAMGIIEDPATGAAAVALAGELAARLGVVDNPIDATIHQGEAIGRPSRLELQARVENGAVVEARLGGPAVVLGEGALWLPD